MTNREDKRAKFQTKPARNKRFNGRYAVVVGIVALLIVVGGIYKVAQLRNDKASVEYTDTAGAEETSSNIDATPVDAVIGDGSVSIPVETVRANKFVEFSYSKDGKEVPLLAYVAPSGKINAAVRMCEPCNSQSFHIEDDEIVCNACGTRWKTEDLQGVSGGCLTYPPDKLEYQEKDGRLVIPEKSVADWKPRV